ncbi:MAG: hypothetical protein JXQ93_07205 [Flavobacteriaceae bacterium]
MRIIIFIGIIFCCFSCEYFTQKKTEPIQQLDSISFTSVDVSPSFKVCDSIIDKAKKTACFRTTIHQKIVAYISQNQFKVNEGINEIVTLKIRVSDKGDISVLSLNASEKVRKEIPSLERFLRASITSLPKVIPARKMGIPVTSEYEIPIQIKIEE